MDMLKTLSSILALLFCTLCNGQIDSINKLPQRHANLKLSYNTTIIYPGFSAGIEFPVQINKNLLIRKKAKDRIISRSRFISGNINWYHHPNFHNNLYVTAEWVMRRTTDRGIIWEFSCGPGYSRTFLGGTTYRVSDNGDVSVVKLAGYNYALLTVGEGFGIDFSLKKRLPFSTILKLNIISMFPYNSTFYIRPVLEIGVRYSPFRSKMKSKNN
jgi:hypothetical protein